FVAIYRQRHVVAGGGRPETPGAGARPACAAGSARRPGRNRSAEMRTLLHNVPVFGVTLLFRRILSIIGVKDRQEPTTSASRCSVPTAPRCPLSPISVRRPSRKRLPCSCPMTG